jgi:hypothetical protein
VSTKRHPVRLHPQSALLAGIFLFEFRAGERRGEVARNSVEEATGDPEYGDEPLYTGVEPSRDRKVWRISGLDEGLQIRNHYAAAQRFEETSLGESIQHGGGCLSGRAYKTGQFALRHGDDLRPVGFPRKLTFSDQIGEQGGQTICHIGKA